MNTYAYLWLVLASWAHAASLPSRFDLRDFEGKNYVTTVKSQSGGTCWTHGTMAAVEGNLFRTGAWQQNGETGEPALAEYHLDWWNGFNRNFNADIAPEKGGLTVHEGGDYRVAAAYMARGGAVRKSEAQSFSEPPSLLKDTYHFYYARDIEWFAAGKNNENIDKIKQAIMDHGVIGTALDWDDSFYSSSDNTFYQPPSSSEAPNHAVAIVGWDDNKATEAPEKGAWIVKNSWGKNWGDNGYFYISFYDKTSAHHDQMGAVSFKNVERLKYNQIYYHDYHGWRDTKADIQEAFNAYTAKGNAKGKELLTAASFYTAAENVEYSLQIFRKFEGNNLSDAVSIKEGVIPNIGFHTIDLNWPVSLNAGDRFYVYLYLNKGGHPFDKTSDVPVLLGGGTRTIVESRAKPGTSFYRSGKQWIDITGDNKTAKFCMKGLSIYQ